MNVVVGPPPPPPPPNISIKSISVFYPANSAFDANFAIAGQGGFTLLVNGSGFSSSTVVEWNGNPLPTVFGDTTDLAANVSSALIALPGNAAIEVSDSGVSSKTVTLPIASPAAALAGVMALITAAPDGSPANGDSLVGPSISASGRYVAFQSIATNLVAGAASGFQEIYERDTCVEAPTSCTANTIRVTVTMDGSPANAHSRDSAISADGRYVAFDSQATNILPGTSVCGGLSSCVFLRDTCVGVATACTPATSVVSLSVHGAIVPGSGPGMSADGRFVTFGSSGSFIVGNTSTVGDVFVRDTCAGVASGCVPSTTQSSLTSAGAQGNQTSDDQPKLANARLSAFMSWATNMVPGEILVPGIFWRDNCFLGPTNCVPATLRLDVANSGAQPNNFAFTATPAMSADGRLVAFGSGATNLVTTNVQGQANIYVRDTCAGVSAGCTPSTGLVSLANDGSAANCGSPSQGLSMSGNGRFVAFDSIATNLTPDDTFPACGSEDIFVRDTCFGLSSGCSPSTVRVSVANGPNPGISANALSGYPAISADGHYVVFLSSATNFLPGMSGNGHEMVYLAKTGF